MRKLVLTGDWPLVCFIVNKGLILFDESWEQALRCSSNKIKLIISEKDTSLFLSLLVLYAFFGIPKTSKNTKSTKTCSYWWQSSWWLLCSKQRFYFVWWILKVHFEFLEPLRDSAKFKRVWLCSRCFTLSDVHPIKSNSSSVRIILFVFVFFSLFGLFRNPDFITKIPRSLHSSFLFSFINSC